MHRPILLVLTLTAVGLLIVGGCPPAASNDTNDGTTETQGQDLTLGNDPLPTAADAPAVTPPSDTDNDGLSDAEEDELGTSKSAADTDGDSLTDKYEVSIGLSPTVANALSKITRVECQSCVVTEGEVLWFSWSTWTDAFKDWKVGQRVYAEASGVDAYLYNVDQTTVLSTLSRSLGTRTGSGTITAITTEDDVPVKFEIAPALWDVAASNGSILDQWAVGDPIVYAHQSSGGGAWHVINTKRNEYITVTEVTGG